MWAAMGATSGHDYPGSGDYTTGYTKAFAGSTGSNSIGDYAWYGDNSGSTTHPVGTKLADKLGLYDMSGNVWELTWDWWASYPSGELADPSGPVSGTYRMVRGGSFYDSASIRTCSMASHLISKTLSCSEIPCDSRSREEPRMRRARLCLRVPDSCAKTRLDRRGSPQRN